MQKDDLNVHVFQYKNWCSSKSDRWFFFLNLTLRGPFQEGFYVKKTWGYGVNFWKKTEVLYAELNKRAEAATGSYYVTGNYLFIYLTVYLFCACD